MNTKWISACIALALASITQVRAGRTTGNELLFKCRSAETLMTGEKTEDIDAVKDFTECLGYITGVAEVFEIQSAVALRKNPEQAFVCFPPSSSKWQITQVVLKYLKGHPEELHLQAVTLLFPALAEAFPCPPTKPTTETPKK